jgi:hypothetical protein
MRRSQRPGAGALALPGALAICATMLLLTLVLSGCRVVTGSGELVARTVDATGFTEVRADDSWDVRIKYGESESVQVTCDKDVEDLVDVAVSGDTLVLRLKPKAWLTLSSNVTLRATVVMPRLDGLELSDSSRAAVTGFSAGGRLAVRLRDASSVELRDMSGKVLDARASDACSISGSIQAEEASLRLSDASAATLSGSARTLTLRASDGSSARLRRLRAMDAAAAITDGSEATVAVSGTLEAHVTDGSSLRYVGSPSLGKSMSVSDDSSLEQAGQ